MIPDLRLLRMANDSGDEFAPESPNRKTRDWYEPHTVASFPKEYDGYRVQVGCFGVDFLADVYANVRMLIEAHVDAGNWVQADLHPATDYKERAFHSATDDPRDRKRHLVLKDPGASVAIARHCLLIDSLCSWIASKGWGADKVGIGLYNEPPGVMDGPVTTNNWYRVVLPLFVGVARARLPESLLFLCAGSSCAWQNPGFWESKEGLKFAPGPLPDSNCVLDLHPYFLAPWTQAEIPGLTSLEWPLNEENGRAAIQRINADKTLSGSQRFAAVSWIQATLRDPAQPKDKADMERLFFAPLRRWCDRTGNEAHLGEFGVAPGAMPIGSAVRYEGEFLDLCGTYRFGACVWQVENLMRPDQKPRLANLSAVSVGR